MRYVSLVLSCLILVALYAGCNKAFRIKEASKDRSQENWGQFGRQPERLNQHNSPFLPPLENVWIYKATSAPGPTLLSVDGIVYLMTKDGRLDAVDVVTGKRINRKKLDKQIEATCTYFDGDLYIASRYGGETLARLDLDTGDYVWKIDAGDIASEPLVTRWGVYVAALYKHIDKYSTATGKKKWSFKTEDQLRSSPALGDSTLVVGSDDGTIYALSEKTGRLKWKFMAGGPVMATPVITNQKAFIGSIDSVFYAIGLNSGQIIWQHKTTAPMYQTAATDGIHLFVGCTDGTFRCLNVETGTELWMYKTGSVVSTAPLIAGNTVYFGSLDKNYYGINAETGEELWQFSTRGRIRTSPIIWGDYLLGASEDKYLYAFKRVTADLSKN